jgi:hypothetical protein
MSSIKWRTVLGLLTVLLTTSSPVLAGTQTSSGDINLGATVPGPPPATAPTIDVPTANTTFTQKLIDVKGTCVANLTVRIFRNAIFAGSAFCQLDNTYALQIDLTEGRNDLIARQYDSLNQSSPDSDTVTVYFTPPGGPSLPGENPTPAPTPGSSSANPSNPVAEFQLVIDYDYSFRGVTVNNPLHLPIHFMGGTPPYAVSISWGDREQNVVSRENADQFFVDHIYKKPGVQIVKLRVSDKNGNQAYLQFVLIVNGTAPESPNNLLGTPITHDLLPYVVIPAIVFGAAGLAFGIFFGHRWQMRGKKPQDKDKNQQPQV